MLRRLARWIDRSKIAVLLVAAALLVVGLAWGRGVVPRLAFGGFAVQGGEQEQTTARLAEVFGEHAPDLLVVYSHPVWRTDDPRFRSELAAATARLSGAAGVAAVRAPEGEHSPLVSKDHRYALVAVTFAATDPEKIVCYAGVVAAAHDTELETQVGGRLATYVTAQEIARTDLVRAELVAIPLLFVLLAWFFRSIIAAVLPLVIAGLSITIGMAALRVISGYTEVSLFSLNVVTFLGFGLSVDYSLFVVRRFREELARGSDVSESLERTCMTAGRTILFSGIAVATSLLGLLWFDTELLRSIAIGGTTITTITVVMAVVVLPASLALVGRRIGGRRGSAVAAGLPSRFWLRVAGFVMRRPGWVVVVLGALLVVVALPVRRLNVEVGDAGLFPMRTEVRRVWDLVSDDERFSEHELMPVDVLVEAPDDIFAPAVVGDLFDYGRALEQVAGVIRVDSLVTSGDRRQRFEYQLLGSIVSGLPDELQTRIASVARGNHARLRIVSSYPPSSEEARQQLATIRSIAPERFTIHLAGRAQTAAEIHDDLSARAPYALASIAVVTFLVLFVAFGSVVVPLRAMVMNSLSVAASYGVLVRIFQDGRFESLLAYQSSGAIDPTVLAVTFAVMFGLTMDYEVFLLSRIREEFERSGDNSRAVAIGLALSGRVITGAAAILLAVVAGFVAGEMIFIKQLGVGIAVAVIVDVAIVRAMLVPATMAVIGRWNWWSPTWLRRLWERSHVGLDERHAGAT